MLVDEEWRMQGEELQWTPVEERRVRRWRNGGAHRGAMEVEDMQFSDF